MQYSIIDNLSFCGGRLSGTPPDSPVSVIPCCGFRACNSPMTFPKLPSDLPYCLAFVFQALMGISD